MSSLTVQVAASTDDARNNNGNGTFNATVTTMHLGQNAGVDYWNGFRFLNVTIPQGATINTAYLDLFSAGVTAGSSAPIILYGEAADNPLTFANSTPGKPEGRTHTTASVSRTLLPSVWGSTGFGIDPIDITAIIQEIINRPGWVSGNAIVIVAHNNGAANNNYVGHSTYDFSGNARGGKLILDYTAGTPPTAPTSLAGSQSGNQINLTWTDNASTETGFVLERKRGGSVNYYPIATPAANATSYSDTDVAAGYTYTYRIKARNADGDSTYATSSSVAMSGTKPWTAHIHAWVFPGQTDAQKELVDGRNLYTVKPEYGTINSTTGVYSEPTGFLNGIDDATMTPRAKVYSKKPFYTISANGAGCAAIVADSTKRTNAINAIVATLTSTGFEGVELDWEGYGNILTGGGWSAATYAAYKTFVNDLCTAVHAIGKKVIVCGPPIGDSTEQSYYRWKYEDFESMTVDYILALAYDWDFDFGGGTAIAPTDRVQNVCKWIRGKITDANRIIVGMPNYGYYATTDDYDIQNITEEIAKTRTGYPGTRDTGSQEMIFASGGISTVYNDQTGINSKREIIEDEGIKHISVWHLGDNPWFSGKVELDITRTNEFFRSVRP